MKNIIRSIRRRDFYTATAALFESLDQKKAARLDEEKKSLVEARELSVPEKHQLKIAYQTLKMTDAGARVMGGPSKEEAREIILRLTGKVVRESRESLTEGFHVMKYGGGRYTSVAWCATRPEAEKEVARIKAAGSWSGMPPKIEPDRDEK